MLLAAGAMTPNAIAENFDSSRQAVSKHLRILAECEMVVQKQQGREIFYSINEPKMNEIQQWLEQFKQIFERRFSQLDRILEQLKKQET